MPREPIPEELRRFILTSVPTVPFLEALLLFREATASPRIRRSSLRCSTCSRSSTARTWST